MTNISGISRIKFSALIDMGDSGYSPYTYLDIQAVYYQLTLFALTLVMILAMRLWLL
jgi:hypothetical protein